MSAPVKLQPLETPSGWMVSVPASMSGERKRTRKFFPDKTTAEKYAASLRSAYAKGHRGSLISHSLAVQAAEAERILDGSGITIAEAARMAVARLHADGSRETFAARHARAILAGEASWSDAYRARLDNLPRGLPEWFMQMPCGGIDRTTMERALLEVSPRLFRSTLDVRCRWISSVLGYRERHRKTSGVVILDPNECARLLRACESPDERRAVALLLFAGIRPDVETGEIGRLEWSAIRKDDIYVSGEVSKTNSDRHIPITPRLRRLIRGHPKSGPVIPANWKRVWARLRKAAGIVATDVCRHTFASNFLAAYGEQSCKSAMGHTAGSTTLFRHYRRAVTEDAGKRFFR